MAAGTVCLRDLVQKKETVRIHGNEGTCQPMQVFLIDVFSVGFWPTKIHHVTCHDAHTLSVVI